jgi:phospholipid/cholesterol/gamma-HCH transport system substrate-binding protein
VEIRARYLQVGFFTLMVGALAFAFVYWLNNAGILRDRAVYRVQFQGPVAGLQTGSAVLFNGVRVGEVTRLYFNAAAPQQVHGNIAVGIDTPVRVDTTVSIDFQGLTGSPVIALLGGVSKQPLPTDRDEPPLLVADAAAGQSLSHAARDTLRRLDGVLAENAQPLHNLIGNLESFAGALSRNSERVDGILAGLERMTGGAAAKARSLNYDLTSPAWPEAPARPSPLQLVISDPTALAALDSERIQTISASGAYVSLPDAQWSDALPKLVQVTVLRSLEDSGSFAGVSRPLEAVTGDVLLLLDIRKFQISSHDTAEVEIGCKLIGGTGRFIAARSFHGSAALAMPGTPGVIVALDKAFAEVALQLLTWTTRIASEPAAPAAVGGKRSNGG